MQYLELIGKIEPAQWLRAGAALIACALLIPLLMPFARRLGLVDKPGGRKDHAAPVPVVGGLAILGSLIALILLTEPVIDRGMATFAFAAIGLVLVGQLDDLLDISARWRIGAQALAALVMIFVAGVSATNLQDVFGFAGANIGLWFALPFTVFIVVGVINALNMADGVDGLAGSLSLVSLLLFCCFALYAGDVQVAGYLLAVAGALLGFLFWNFRFPWQPRARVFLGNGGSMLLGFTIAWCSVQLTQNEAHPVSPVLGPWTISLPLLDCIALIFRRKMQGRSPFSADRQHMHHLLLDAGFGPVAVVGLMAGLSLALGLFAAFAILLGVWRPLLVLLFGLLLVAWLAFTRDHDRAVARLRRFRKLFVRDQARLGAEDGRDDTVPADGGVR
jgi:UDP-GlcNAc:undecaprenyl-phosphate GlcNAc-1-phosphate transferase